MAPPSSGSPTTPATCCTGLPSTPPERPGLGASSAGALRRAACRARLQDPETLRARQTGRRVALVAEPGLEGVGAEALAHPHHRTAVRPKPVEPAEKQVVH